MAPGRTKRRQPSGGARSIIGRTAARHWKEKDVQTLAYNLNEKAEFASDGIVSKTIVDEKFAKIILFGFAAGQSLSEHASSMPAVIHILSGKGRVLLGEEWHDAVPGSWFFMPPGLNHAIQADEDTVMLLTMFRGAAATSSGA
jgi:quercetin dioxygenase-like cupin family protein